MGLSKKEEERVERIIRGLLKLPENRRCINCNALGPQYVCTTFSTFICTNCSGLHREFTHRVKSVSMAKFTQEEVTALQTGGNERAKQIYFKGWDPTRHSYPDSSNMHRLREFIKNVYVERKYAGERSQENLPRIKLNDKEESSEKLKSSSFRLEFMSQKSNPVPRSSSARSDDASIRYLYDESRSPKYVQKYTRNGGFSRSPMKFEVVDDRFRDEEYKNRRQSNLESKLRQLSLGSHKNVDTLQAPVQPSSGEMMMQNDLSLQVITSGGEGSVEEKPSDTAIVPVETTPSMTQESENNWASFDTSTKENVPDNVPKTSNTNTMKSPTIEPIPEAKISSPLDLLLFELSGSFAPTTSENVPTTSTVEKAFTLDFPATSMEETNSSASELAQPSNEATPSQFELLETEASIEVSHAHKAQTEASIEVSHAHKPQTEDSIEVLHAHKQPTMQSTQPTSSTNKDIASNNEPSFSLNTHESSHAFDELSSQTASNPTQDTRPNLGYQPSTVETKSSGRMELPEDLFTTKYFSGPAPPHPGWQNLQSHVMGYGLQYYPNALPPHPQSALPIAPKSMNPFDVTEGRGLSPALSVPALASMQGVVPATSHRTGLIHTSSLGSLDTMIPQSTSYTSIGLMHTSSLGSLDTMMPQSTSYAPPITGLCFDQVNNEDQYHRSKIVNTYNSDISGFGSLDTIQQSYGAYGTHGIPNNSFSNTRRNPFEFE